MNGDADVTVSAGADIAANTAHPRVTLLTRSQCHLCEPVRATVEQVCTAAGESWHEVNVDSDPDLRSEYGDQVPVVLVDGEFFASLRLDADTLAAALNRLA
ncbi:MAG: glutaredoxin family protein [Nakamurella sp.]